MRTQEEHAPYCWGQDPDAIWNWTFNKQDVQLQLTKGERREAVRSLSIVAADDAKEDRLNGVDMLLLWNSGYCQRRLAKHLVFHTGTLHALEVDIDGLDPEELEFDHAEGAVAVVRAAQWVGSDLDDLFDDLDDEAIHLFARAVVRAAQQELDNRLEELREENARE